MIALPAGRVAAGQQRPRYQVFALAALLLNSVAAPESTYAAASRVVVEARGPPVVALNASAPGSRAYFPAALSWAGQTLLLGVNTQSDNLHDEGMRGRTVASVDGGVSWKEMAQPLAPWQLEACCLPSTSRDYLAFSYELRRQALNDSSRAFVHAMILQQSGSSANAPMKQVAAANVTFHFSDPLLQPAAYRAIGCPQSPDSPCNKTSGLALPTQSFAFQNTGNLVGPAHPHSSRRLLTSIYGVYEKDWPVSAVPAAPQYPPSANYSIAIFQSDDDGKSWEYIATAAGRSAPASAAHYAGVCVKGASENHFVRLHDGSLFLVHRVSNDAYDLCYTRSTEDGQSWTYSKPLQSVTGTALWGVAPKLLLLSNNVLALTTGRPGLMMWTISDASSATVAGESRWQGFNIAAAHNRWAGKSVPKFLSNCSHYGLHNCSLPGGSDVPGRAGVGSTTSYTGLVRGQRACADNTCTVLVSYDWLGNGWQPVPTDGPGNLILVMQLTVSANGEASTLGGG